MIPKLKKYLTFAFIITVLATSGVAYAKTGSRVLSLNKAEAKKSEKNKKNINEEKEKPVSESAGVDNQSQPVLENVSESVEANNQPQPVETVSSEVDQAIVASRYPIHKNITATFFWAGEEAGKDNKNISNLPSAWDENWVKHFGGVDNPNKRNGFFPAGFSPKENPFYVALPYNDFDKNGNRKSDIVKLAAWAKDKKCGAEESYCKNHWVKIIKNEKATYAQWEDVGPFKEDDSGYVFGSAAPKSKTNKNAGIDVSPAVRDYLGLADIDKVDWQFVDSNQVPEGPWKKVVTTSQIYWK